MPAWLLSIPEGACLLAWHAYCGAQAAAKKGAAERKRLRQGADQKEDVKVWAGWKIRGERGQGKQHGRHEDRQRSCDAS